MAYIPVTLLKSVNFGRSGIGLSTVGYTLYDESGEIFKERTTEGVHEVGINTGIYAAKIEFTSTFPLGSILWDSGTDPVLHATEQYNINENNGNMLDWTAGRWSIDPRLKMMNFYAQDNSCIIARFSLYDRQGKPSIDEVFTRIRNDQSLGGPYLDTNAAGNEVPYGLDELLEQMPGHD